MIPGANDGIGISNGIARWIITDENWGRFWSVELFKRFYDSSTIVLIIAIIIFITALAVETKNARKEL
jgi:uncharacterized membrane protein